MIQKTILDNGLTIVTKYIESIKTATISYTIKCGCYNEDKSNLGIAHFTEHMLFKGTTNRNSKDISESIEGIGGILNAETSFQHTKYYCTIPSEFWKIGVEILSDMIINNTLPEDEFVKEKQVILEELKMYNDEPQSKIWDLLFTKLHPSYLNRQYVGGTVETVSKLTREQMVNFIDKFYAPNNMVLITTGNVKHDDITNFVKNYFSKVDFEHYEPVEEKEFIPDKLNSKSYTLKKDVIQSHFCWGMFGPKASDKESVVGQVIASLLGGNSSSRLYQIIREQKGLAYSVNMQIELLKDTSILSGYVGLDGNNIAMVKQVVVDEMNKLKTEDVDEQELTRVKNYIEGIMLIQFERTGSQNKFISDNLLNDTSVEIDDLFKQIESVTTQDIKNFANKYFNKENICFAQIIPK